MNKKFLSIIVSSFMLINASGVVAFADKKDVGDPVLQEVINELSKKMPRFINKYGDTVFVADEQITRGALLQALYEYDKMAASGRTSASSEGVVSKKEYDALNAKIAALEKKLKDGAGTATAKAGGESADFVSIMGDLETNMPVILDNTLADSKVFKALERKIEDVKESASASAGAGVNANVMAASVDKDDFNNLKNTVIQINQNYAAIDKKLEDLRKDRESDMETSRMSSATSQTALADLQKDFDELNKKLGNMETSLASVKSSSDSSAGVSQTAVADLRKNIADLTVKMESMEKSQQNTQTTLALNKTSSEESKTEIESLRSNITALGNKLNLIEKEQQNAAAVSKLSSSDANVSKAALADLQKNLDELSRKMANVETSVASVKTSSESTANTSQTAVAGLQKNLADLNKKVSSMEMSIASAKKSGSSKPSEKMPSNEEIASIKNMVFDMDKKIGELEKGQQNITLAATASANKKESADAVSKKTLSDMQKNITTLTQKLTNMEKQQQMTQTTLAANKSLSDVSKETLNELQKNIDALSSKINTVERNQQQATLALNKTSSSDTKLSQTELTKLQKNMTDLNKKFSDMEMSFASVKKSAEMSNNNVNVALAAASAEDSKAINVLKKDFQKEMDAINKKVSAMEQNFAKNSKAADASIYSGPSQEDFNSLRKSVAQMNKNYVAINKKLDDIEKDQQSFASVKSSSDSGLSAKQMNAINAKINSIRQSVDDIRSENKSSSYSDKNTADIKRIEKRLAGLERSEKTTAKAVSGSSDSSDSGSSGKSGTVAKISLGLSLVAVLFVAR